MPYHPETYWSRVATEIASRGSQSFVAGDDDPFYRYKRRKFVQRFLHTIDFASKVALEVGCGPGGNLIEIARMRPARLIGVDISEAMLELAARNLALEGQQVELHKIDGTHIPLPDRSVDVALTVTVLQHNTDASMLERLVAEICRVTRGSVVLVEDIGTSTGPVSPDSSGIARPVSVYEGECARHGFGLARCEHLGLRASRRAHAMTWHYLGPRVRHREGEPCPLLLKTALRLALPVTSRLDDSWEDRSGLARMVFSRG